MQKFQNPKTTFQCCPSKYSIVQGEWDWVESLYFCDFLLSLIIPSAVTGLFRLGVCIIVP